MQPTLEFSPTTEFSFNTRLDFLLGAKRNLRRVLGERLSCKSAFRHQATDQEVFTFKFLIDFRCHDVKLIGAKGYVAMSRIRIITYHQTATHARKHNLETLRFRQVHPLIE